MYWVYILENLEGRFYIGQTNNLKERLESHHRQDRLSGKFARKHGPWEPVWTEEHPLHANENLTAAQAGNSPP